MPGPLFRIPVPASPGFERRELLSPRREHTSLSDNPKASTIVIASVVAGIVVLLVAAITIRTLRSRHPNPKYIPTPFLKRLWSDWKVRPAHNGPHAYEPTGASEDDISRRSTRNSLSTEPQTREQTTTTNPAGGVDRNTSVRSVMTLPVYRPRAAETEQVLGREGERDGIDVVVEMPTAEDEEALREEEMNALYQIRLTRRQQIAEREERRRLRREARETNNVVALTELRNRTRDAAGRNTEAIEELRAEHERIRETRQRAVSSVSYGDLGVARADGTRIRANSTESERVGLLSDAASIGTAGAARSPGVDGSGLLIHRRDRSTGSIISIDTARSNDIPPESPSVSVMTAGGSSYSLASMGRVRSNSGVNTPRASIATTRAGSSPEIIDAEDGDLGDTSMPPPGYDDVSLDDVSSYRGGGGAGGASVGGGGDISGRNSPYNEPPPDYPGPAQVRNNRLSAHMEDLAVSASRSRASSAASGMGPPQLPGLQLPQIVIDPAVGR